MKVSLRSLNFQRGMAVSPAVSCGTTPHTVTNFSSQSRMEVAPRHPNLILSYAWMTK